MENYHYICHYCGKEYVPTRRKVQKHCSNSCRTRSYQLRNPKLGSSISMLQQKKNPTQIDKVSLAGVANAALGTVAVDLAKYMFTPDDNKAATKKDIREIKELVTKRYHQVLNLNKDISGNSPFFDMLTKKIVYLKL